MARQRELNDPVLLSSPLRSGRRPPVNPQEAQTLESE